MLTVGIDGASCRAALAAAEAFPQVYAAIGRHPNAATGFDDADLAELRALAAHERCLAIGETGLDFYRDGAPRADQERAFAAQIALARETGKPLVIHSRAAEEETLAQLAAEADGVSVVMHCFSMPERLEECLERGYAISFAGNVTYKSAAELAEAARAGARRAPAGRDRRALPDAAGRAQAAQPAGVRRPHGWPSWPSCAGSSARRAGRDRRAQRGARVRLGMSAVADAPVQPSLRRMRQFGVRPDRELGQNFLIDSNILGVIDRAAELRPEDVVLEIGGGLGRALRVPRRARRARARGRGRRAPARGAAATRPTRTPT